MTDNAPDYEDNLYFDAQNKENEQQNNLYIKVEQQVWESTLNRSMNLQAENEELTEILERHKKATAKAQIRSCDLEIINSQLKELLKECKMPLEVYNEMFGNKEELLAKIDEALK